MPPSPPRYHVYFAGELKAGYDRESVKQALAKALRLSEQQSELLFSGKKGVVTRTDELAKAEAFVRLFANAGAVAAIEPHNGSAVAQPAVQQSGGEPLGGVATDCPPFRPFRTHLLFKPALLLATLIESLLSLFYVVALLGALLLLVYHTLLADWLFEKIPNPWLAAPLLALLLLLGIFVLAMLAKPLLGMVRRKEPFFELKRELEPEFFSYVEDICSQAGVIPPQRIRINHRSVIALRLHRNWPLLWKRDRVLTLGLPLLAGLDSRQLAALLVETLALWRPGIAHLAGRMLEANFSWLQRAAYEHDIIDRKLHAWQRAMPRFARGLGRMHSVARWSALPARLRIGFSRFLSRRLLHRLQADSDLLAARVAGTQAMGNALVELRLLRFAAQNTLSTLTSMWLERRVLPENIADAIVARASLYPLKVHRQLEEVESSRNRECNGFRPTTGQRLTELGNHQEPGSYEIAAPCAAYFRRLEKLMLVMTSSYYHGHLAIPITINKLIRTPAKGSQEFEANNQLHRYFTTVYADFVPLRLRAQFAAIKGTATQLAQQWQQAAGQITAAEEKSRNAALVLAQRDERVIELSNRELLGKSGMGSLLSGLSLTKGRGVEELQQACRDAEQSYEQGVGELAKHLTSYTTRMTAALALLDTPELQRRMGDAAQRWQEVGHLLAVHDRIESNYPKLRELRLQTILLESLLGHQLSRSSSKLEDRIRELSDDINRAVASLSLFYRNTSYPLETEERYDNLFDWVLAQAADGESPTANFDRGNDTVRRLALMQRLVVGRLVTLALQVELLLGLTMPKVIK